MRLKTELREGASPTPKRPRTLSLGVLTQEPHVFQMRTLAGSLQRFDETVAKLLSLLRQGRQLDPVRVWWTGKRWVLLDGHHRLEAYRQFAEAKQIPEAAFKVSVAVVVADTVDDAERAAHEDNAKIRNASEDIDRRDLAWKLTVEDPTRSYGFIQDRTGVSKGTAQNMRKVYFKLKDRRWSVAGMMQAGWAYARKGAADEKPDMSAMTEDELLGVMLREADFIEERLRKTFGQKWTKKWDAFALLLSQRHPIFLRRMLDSHYFEIPEEMEQDDFDDDIEDEAVSA
ncbi:ParB/Srx family N-terminal domain-containing protein [Marinovum sp. 2_MG-2023]|uniref:ParB/Srx family N-terminal domain-containing protein n=1 Tax=unclassified Marinovum TaxID=2647166 RepID=UPI0026E2ACEA|nr:MULTISPECIES: ParB/Srx family N-terminal domain-containing protein [unclassified Marinovum]MDO6729868.1 ParB/Srx family N-terminal domain-containing protein [Marinovum sp. 2_MG-2023]MDO6779682.1 ParB/Srx family N-terminal domain-containing protein [Marinovum sp. 1_MG-2023]